MIVDYCKSSGRRKKKSIIDDFVLIVVVVVYGGKRTNDRAVQSTECTSTNGVRLWALTRKYERERGNCVLLGHSTKIVHER